MILKFCESIHKNVDSINNATFNLDGRFIVTTSKDTVYLWNTRKGELLKTFKVRETNQFSTTDNEHEEEGEIDILNVAISPDGKLMVIVSEDRTVHLWDIQSAKRT